ncbi:MAG: hypothetical protein LBG64_00200, partial [Pseudomonadales bacterium]|nr:hypothetical protein [Pseudomonadales bacterium]
MQEKIYTITKDKLRLTVSNLGAEINSLIYLPTEQEVMWQADPDVWKGTAPILFPYVGNLKNKQFFYKDEGYHGERHGFARRSFFEVDESRADEGILTCRLDSSEETRKQYP